MEKSKTNQSKGRSTQLTTTGGNPVADNQNSLTTGPRSPLLMQGYQLIEKLAHQNHECIFERNVRATGSAAYGTLTIPHEIVQSPRPGAVNASSLQPKVDRRCKFLE